MRGKSSGQMFDDEEGGYDLREDPWVLFFPPYFPMNFPKRRIASLSRSTE